MIGEILYVMTCDVWIADDNITQLFKIGSTHNLVARRKNARTWLHKKINIKGYYLLKNCVIQKINCYVLDNLVKIHFNEYRVKEVNAGTEFYREFDLQKLSDFIKLMNIDAEWIDHVDETTIVTKDDLLKDYSDEIDHYDSYEKFLKEFKMFSSTNFLISPLGKSNKEFYNNYLKTIVNGIQFNDVDKDKYKIENKTDSYLYFWSTKNQKINDKIKKNDILFLTVTCNENHKIHILKVNQIIESSDLSNRFWNTDNFHTIFVLEKITVKETNVPEFLKEYCNYNIIYNIQGNIILDKNKQKLKIDKLSEFIT